jgi:hypothetical protein
MGLLLSWKMVDVSIVTDTPGAEYREVVAAVGWR